MAVTMDMLSIIKRPAPPGPIPAGLKTIALTDPSSLQSAPLCPALGVGGFTYWPMSYLDNRVSFGIVSYDEKGGVVKVLEMPGARYITKITLDGQGTAGSVTFWGQANQKVTMNLNQVYDLLVRA